jgi:hypothetical protein
MAEIAIVAGLFGSGFLAGYSLRAYMSFRRREKARRQVVVHQS